MTIPKLLDRASDVAEILTAVVAIWFGLVNWRWSGSKVKEVEAELKQAWEHDHDRAGRTIEHITVTTGLTEREILRASLNSRYIRRHAQHGVGGQTERVLLVYDPNGNQNS